MHLQAIHCWTRSLHQLCSGLGQLAQQRRCAGGERYLDTREHELHWWQLALLDIYAVLALTAALVLGLGGGLAWLAWRGLTRSRQRKAKLL